MRVLGSNIAVMPYVDLKTALEGQATAQIKVDASNVNAEEITATVEVEGFGPECENKATRTIRFGSESNSSEKSDSP